MNIFFVMQSPEYIRFYDSTIRLLVDRGHQVTLAVNKQNEAKPVRLDTVGGGGVVAFGVLPRRDDVWRGVGRRLRGVIDFVRYWHPRLAQAPALRARMKHKVLPAGFHALDRVRSLPDGVLRTCLAVLRACERAIPTSRRLQSVLQQAGADVVLVTPLVDAASDQVEVVKAARALGVPVGACIASWDNLTNKGLLRVVPDRVFVWNDAQKQEAADYHGVPPSRIVTTGAQVFDRWFGRRPGARAEFCATVGLPPGRPYLLYTCSSSFIALSPAEVEFVKTWIAAVRRVPELAETSILIRPHPYNGSAWETADLSAWPHVQVWPRGAYNPMAEESRTAFFESLAHSAAVIGINTSAMIEAAILGRPVLSFVADRFTGTQEGTLHFHYLLPENGGFLRMADTVAEHVTQLTAVMRDPAGVEAQTTRFVSHFLRPHGLDQDCAPRLAAAIESLGHEGPRAPTGLPWWGPLLWPILLAANVYAFLWMLKTDAKAAAKFGKQWRGRMRDAMGWVRAWPERLRGGSKRGRKAVSRPRP